MNLGQEYTKEIVADYMVSLIDLPKDSYVIDPCFGYGVFVNSLSKAKFTNITSIEIDKDTFENTQKSLSCLSTIVNDDFFRFSPKRAVDVFILNPPYVRQEEIDNMESIGVTKQSIISKCGAFKIHSKANLYLYFIARCITLLRDGGQMVAIFPNAWLNTPDGKFFFNQIENAGRINNIIQVNGSPFVGNPLVDVMILKFTKGAIGNTKRQLLNLSNDSIELSDDNSKVELNSVNCIPLSSIAHVRRGVTTGYNKVFINPSVGSAEILTDIISTPRDVVGYSTKGSRHDLLLSIKDNSKLTNDILEYLDKSAELILQEGKPKTLVSLIKNDKAWYIIKIPEISDIIFPYIIRDTTRFILNDDQTIVRDNFYTIKSNCNSFLLLALLNNLFVYSQLETNGKSYGNGILKIQKYDVDNISVANPSILDEITKETLIKCSKELVRTGKYEYILEITKIISKYYDINNIEKVYKIQKYNRLRYEL